MTESTLLPLTGDISDFEIAIRGAALLDDHLQSLLTTALHGNEEAQSLLLSRPAHFRTLAFCTDLISERDYSDLKAIASVRNKFSHPSATNPPAFGHPTIREHIGSLTSYQEGKENGLNERAIFVKAISHLSSRLNHRLAQVKLHKAQRQEAVHEY